MGNLTDKPELNEKKGKIGNLDSPKNPFDYSKREYGTVPLDTKRAPFQWVSEVAYKNVHRIVCPRLRHHRGHGGRLRRGGHAVH